MDRAVKREREEQSLDWHSSNWMPILNNGGDKDSVVIDKNSADNSECEGDQSFVATTVKCFECRMNKLYNEANRKIDELRKEINSLKEAESTYQLNSTDHLSSLQKQNEELAKENKELQERISYHSYILADKAFTGWSPRKDKPENHSDKDNSVMDAGLSSETENW